jgi:hypothetical protein
MGDNCLEEMIGNRVHVGNFCHFLKKKSYFVRLIVSNGRMEDWCQEMNDDSQVS